MIIEPADDATGEVAMDQDTARKLLVAELRTATSVAEAQVALLEEAADEIFDELSSTDQHQADSGTETFEREKALTILRLAEERRADVERALEKLLAGTYGTCEACGRPIDDERLEARPDARFCVAHVPAPPRPAPERPDPGWLELDLVPDDDLDEAPVARSAEEAAMHLEPRPE